jgi:AcrR family transcriptional regulator
MVATKYSPAGEQRPISAEEIVTTAIQISDEHGLERLTLRKIASTLDIGTMTLYGYFRSKDEILDRMADYVLGNLTLPAPAAEGETPAKALRVVGWGFLEMMNEHPSVVRILATRVTNTAAARHAAMEVVLERLVAAGIPGELAVRCYGHLMIYALGFSMYQTPRSWGQDQPEDRAERTRQMTHYYASLPKKDFPLLIELKESVVMLPSNIQFEFGIDSLTRMVENQSTA